MMDPGSARLRRLSGMTRRVFENAETIEKARP